MAPAHVECRPGAQHLDRVVVCLACASSSHSQLLGAVAGIRHDGPLSTHWARLCAAGVVEERPGGQAGGAVFGAELRVAVKGRPRERIRCGRYPRLDFFRLTGAPRHPRLRDVRPTRQRRGVQCPTVTNVFEHVRNPFELMTGAHGAAPVTQLLPQMNSCCRRVNSCKHQA